MVTCWICDYLLVATDFTRSEHENLKIVTSLSTTIFSVVPEFLRVLVESLVLFVQKMFQHF